MTALRRSVLHKPSLPNIAEIDEEVEFYSSSWGGENKRPWWAQSQPTGLHERSALADDEYIPPLLCASVSESNLLQDRKRGEQIVADEASDEGKPKKALRKSKSCHFSSSSSNATALASKTRALKVLYKTFKRQPSNNSRYPVKCKATLDASPEAAGPSPRQGALKCLPSYLPKHCLARLRGE